MTTREAVDVSNFEATNPLLGAIVSLPAFLQTIGELTPAERRTIVEQALILIDDLYVHLPLKRAGLYAGATGVQFGGGSRRSALRCG